MRRTATNRDSVPTTITESASDAPELNPRDIVIPENELEITFARSGGPGGQHVNKVNTKAMLKWNYMNSKVLSLRQKGIISSSAQFRNRINVDGVIFLQDSSTRSQSDNKTAATERLHNLMREALRPKKDRKATTVSTGAKERRRKDRELHSRRKANRRRVAMDSD